MAKKTANSILKKMKVKAKLTFLLILVAYSSIFLVSVMSFIVARNIINERIEAELVYTTENIMESVDLLIYNRSSEMQILASESRLLDSGASTEEKTEILRNRLIRSGWFDNLYLTDKSGTINAATDKSALGSSIYDQDWFQDTLQNGNNISDVTNFLGKENKTLIFSIVLNDEKNATVGVAFAEFSLNVLTDLLKNTPEDLEIYLLTQSNELITEKTERTIPYSSQLIYDKGYLSHQISSNGYLAYKGNGWKLLVQIPKKVAYVPLRQLSFLLFATVILVSLEIVFLGQAAAKNFVKPIDKLTEGVRKIQKGNLNQKIIYESQDEFGFLAKNFNEMTASLSEKTRNLLSEKGKYKSILESSKEGIILFDKDNHVLAYNPQYKKILHFEGRRLENAEKIFADFIKVQGNAPLDPLLQKIKTIIETKNFTEEFSGEVTIEKPDYKILGLYTKPVSTESGELLGRIWVVSDITESREAEASKNEFIRTASHRIRTPITAINWSIEMIKDKNYGSFTEDQKTVFEQISINTGRLNTMVEALLNVAEIDKNTVKLNPEVFQLKVAIDNSVAAMNAKWVTKDSNLLVDNQRNESIAVKADFRKTEKILTMLLRNALLYGKDNSTNNVTLTVTTDKKSKKVTISISDEGIGINAKEKRKIFSKFFRGEKALLKYTDGIGLDLYLVKIFCETAGEKVWFESEEGKGSTFYFTLPLA